MAPRTYKVYRALPGEHDLKLFDNATLPDRMGEPTTRTLRRLLDGRCQMHQRATPRSWDRVHPVAIQLGGMFVQGIWNGVGVWFDWVLAIGPADRRELVPTDTLALAPHPNLAGLHTVLKHRAAITAAIDPTTWGKPLRVALLQGPDFVVGTWDPDGAKVEMREHQLGPARRSQQPLAAPHVLVRA